MSVNNNDSIQFKSITPSALNPRVAREDKIDTLVKSVESSSLIHPVMLRKLVDQEGQYELITGSRRFQALQKMRGAEGSLNPGEYKIVEWDNEHCMLAIYGENKQRKDFSPIEEGRFICTMEKSLGATSDAELAGKLGISRQRINTTKALARDFELLPESWQKELLNGSSLITNTHFKLVRHMIKDGTIPEEVRKLMEQAVGEKWSASEFQSHLDKITGTSRTANYSSVRRSLGVALKAAGADKELRTAISQVLSSIKTQEAEKDATKKVKTAKPVKAAKQKAKATPDAASAAA